MLQRHRQGTVDVIRCTEAMIEEHLAEISALIDECLQSGQPRAVLDLELVPLVDSQGLERLLDAQERFGRRGGRLKLAAPNELCKEILACTGVADQIEVFSDVKTAIGSFVQ